MILSTFKSLLSKRALIFFKLFLEEKEMSCANLDGRQIYLKEFFLVLFYPR
jgi:hypothetical protein